MEERKYAVPPYGDGAGSEPTSAGEPVSPDIDGGRFQQEVNEKLDAILAALGINEKE